MSEDSQDRRLQARQKAQTHFTPAEQRDSLLKKEMESERARGAAKRARLRALRLAKESSDEAAKSAAEEPQASPRRAKPNMRRITPG